MTTQVLTAGRELDALVAEKVMGFDMTKPAEFRYPIGMPRYSTDIGAAWTVVEKFRSEGKPIVVNAINELIDRGNVPPNDTYIVWFDDVAAGEPVEAGTMPEAICLAALKAVGHDH